MEKSYNIDLKYYISRSSANDAIEVAKSVDNAISKYILWQKTTLGKDINPSKLNQMLMETGIKRVEIMEPLFTSLEYNQVGICDTINTVFGGFENE